MQLKLSETRARWLTTKYAIEWHAEFENPIEFPPRQMEATGQGLDVQEPLSPTQSWEQLHQHQHDPIVWRIPGGLQRNKNTWFDQQLSSEYDQSLVSIWLQFGGRFSTWTYWTFFFKQFVECTNYQPLKGIKQLHVWRGGLPFRLSHRSMATWLCMALPRAGHLPSIILGIT